MTTRRKPTVTLTDVARRAGVSVATASKALNSGNDVAPGTRRRVMRAAEELAFRPNALARGLISGRTSAVGLLTDELGGRFAIPVLLGIENTLGSGEMSVMLCDSRGDAIRRQHYIRSMLARQVDGFIVLGDSNDIRASLREEIPVPVVYAYCESDDPADVSVLSDDRAGARLAMEHLVSLGRRHIGHITGEETYRAARERAEAVREVLAEAGLPLAGGVPFFGEWTRRWGRHAARLLLAAHPETDAVFCGSDQVANGVIETILESGRRIPDDVAVVGYDNWEVFSADSRPPLTTVDLDLQRLGATAASHLLDALNGRPASGVVRLPGRLVVRESTGPLPRTGGAARPAAPAGPAPAESGPAGPGPGSDPAGAVGAVPPVEQWVPDPLWRIAAPLLPSDRPSRPQGGGRRRAPDRSVLAALLYLASTGGSWRTLPPAMFGVSGATVQRRLAEWQGFGVFARLGAALDDLPAAATASQTPGTESSNWLQMARVAVPALASPDARSYEQPKP
ncbi:substrate-binding domain-containing protein [Streptomyces sp. 6N223]|uniref:substrate-binding domain-containing protein n=1 Tax=Streptomyces sp. 6N223 TaxID=3457412 RepID=UPI003FD609A3